MSLIDFEGDVPETPKVTPKVHLVTSFNELNLETELLKQYNRAETLISEVMHDPETPLNQKAQTLNTITSILASITKQQTDIYNAGRLRIIEDVLLETLKPHAAIHEEFLIAYKAALERAGSAK